MGADAAVVRPLLREARIFLGSGVALVEVPEEAAYAVMGIMHHSMKGATF